MNTVGIVFTTSTGHEMRHEATQYTHETPEQCLRSVKDTSLGMNWFDYNGIKCTVVKMRLA